MQSRVDSPRFIFIHIPKTAGQSFARFLANPYANRDRSRVLTVWDKKFGAAMSPQELAMTPADRLAEYELIWGHFGFTAIKPFLDSAHGRRFHLMTIIREPLQRAVSMFNYIAHHEFHPQHKESLRTGLEGFLEQSFKDNHQCRMVSGSTVAASAIARMQDTFSSYCVLDDIDNYCDRLKQAFPIFSTSSLDRINPSRQPHQMVPSRSVVERFYRMNSEDLALYNWTVRHWREPWKKALA